MGVGVLIDGKWTDDDETYRKGGAFVRATTAFRAFVTADGSSAFPAEAGRYHLYVARPCPWCHRTITRPPCAFRAAISGKTFAPGLEEPPMFKMPAYDPVGIAILGFGVLAVVALGFAFY